MIIKILQNVFRFLVLVLLQVLLLNHIQWSGFVNPYIYILFILLLPFETPKWLLLVSAFFMGLAIDMFGDTGGMHAAASVAVAFARPGLLRLIAPRDGYEAETRLSPFTMGFKWFVTYASMAVLLHHLVYFFIEAFRFSEFFYTLFKVILNSFITIVLIVLGEYIFSRRNKKSDRVFG